MNRSRLIKNLLLVTFVILTAISAMGLFYVYQKPIREKQIIVLGTYIHESVYDYTAELKPNIIYNKTTLKSGEGILYTAITTGIDITFAYRFISNPNPETANMTMEVTMEIESPEKWTKTLRGNEIKEFMELKGPTNFTFRINFTAIRHLVDRIDKEVGTYSPSFNIRLKPTIYVSAVVARKIINETYVPELIIMFKTGTEKGNYISVEGLNQTKSKNITEVREIAYPEIEFQRNILSAATLATAIGLLVSTIAHVKAGKQRKVVERRKHLIRTIEEYRDAIAEVVGSPPEAQATIEVENLEELVKIAQILAKPILKAKKDEEQIFYVMDGNIKYQYKTKM